ncbi:SUKH-3 domain-containing protein [Micromonospora zhanjiangensis]
MADRFNPEVEAALRDAGWTPGRHLSPDAVTAMHRAVAAGRGRYDGQLTSAYLADPVLAEFGGLVIARDGAGVDLNPRPFAIDPSLAVRNVETLIDVGRAMGSTLYPLGVEGMDEAVLAITDQGKVISIDPVGEWFLGNTFDEALDTLVTGRTPRPVGPEDGRTPRGSLRRSIPRRAFRWEA